MTFYPINIMMPYGVPAPSTVSGTIRGAPGETVTYTGASSGSVSLNSDGEATLELTTGDYTFTGSVSQQAIPVVTATLTAPFTVAMWAGTFPLFWFGKLLNGAEIYFKTSRSGSDWSRQSCTIANNEIYMDLASGASQTRYGATSLIKLDPVERGFNTFNVLGKVNRNTTVGASTTFVATSQSHNWNFEPKVGLGTDYGLAIADVSNLSGSRFIGFEGYASGYTTSAYIKAAWLN